MASSSSVMYTQDTNNYSPGGILILLSVALGLGVSFILVALLWECFCCKRRRQNTAISNEASIDQHNNNRAGLSLSSIASLPTFEFKRFCDDNNGEGWAQCSVCLNMVLEREKVRQLTDCKHLFHPECIDMWLYSHSTCPLCRSEVTEWKKNESIDASSEV